MSGRAMGVRMRVAALPEPLAPGAEALAARGARVDIDGRAILADVDLAVHAGELLALVGPNGAGKSTLLGALAGDLALDAGRVLVAGRDLAAWRLDDLARRRAVLAQHNEVAFPFTVLQIVEMGRAPWRRTEREGDDEAAVDEALRMTDIERFAERRFPSLSGGERARAALARVLAQRTGILLLDEPTAALDIRHQEAVLTIARERARAGDAVVVVLHDLGLAAAYADRVAMLAGGRVQAIGQPDAVLTAERVSAVYEHPVEVIHHPATGRAIIVPIRQ